LYQHHLTSWVFVPKKGVIQSVVQPKERW